jgi:CHASE3 domain sensor protein
MKDKIIENKIYITITLTILVLVASYFVYQKIEENNKQAEKEALAKESRAKLMELLNKQDNTNYKITYEEI